MLRLGVTARADFGEPLRDVVVAIDGVPDAAQGLVGTRLGKRGRGRLRAHPLPVRAGRLRPVPQRVQEDAGVSRRVRPPGRVACDLASGRQSFLSSRFCELERDHAQPGVHVLGGGQEFADRIRGLPRVQPVLAERLPLVPGKVWPPR